MPLTSCEDHSLLKIYIGGLWSLGAYSVSGFVAQSSPGHRPVIVKRAVIGSKGRWKLRTIFVVKCFVICR